MPTVELDEAEYHRLFKLNSFANQMAAHPKAGLLLEEAAKLVDPNIRTPRLERAAASEEPIKALSQKFSDLQAQLAKDAADRAQNETLANLAKVRAEGIAALRRQGYTDEGITNIEKVMTEKGVLDPLDAAAIFERNNPPPQIAKPHVGQSWNFGAQEAGDTAGDKAIAALMSSRGEDEGALDTLTSLALKDVRQGYQR